MSGEEISKNKDLFVQYFPASKVLQSKAPLIGKSLDSALSEANGVFDLKRDDFLEWIQEDIKFLEKALQKLITASDAEKDNRAIYKIAYAMAGQGGSFDYPLITLIANNLCKLLDNNSRLNSQGLDAVELHIVALKHVITKRLSGKGDKSSKEVILGLTKITDRLS